MDPIYFQKKGYEEFRFLSNFHMKTITMRVVMESGEVEMLDFPSVEHYYQAMKAEDERDLFRIKDLATPKEAKDEGRKVKMAQEWEMKPNGGHLMVKEVVMLNGLFEKFKDPELKAKLLATGNRPLIEYAPWGDTYWGVDAGLTGRNTLGSMLMLVRSILAAPSQ
jgi:ribA/ribD-fused uncharacterized protein